VGKVVESSVRVGFVDGDHVNVSPVGDRELPTITDVRVITCVLVGLVGSVGARCSKHSKAVGGPWVLHHRTRSRSEAIQRLEPKGAYAAGQVGVRKGCGR
jgi:hypothetical protein